MEHNAVKDFETRQDFYKEYDNKEVIPEIISMGGKFYFTSQNIDGRVDVSASSYDSLNGVIISQQKGIAVELLNKLKGADPCCILAGGAPRDWYLGEPCNDLDIYIHIPHQPQAWDELRWRSLGLPEMRRLGENRKDPNKYKSMPNLRKVYEGVYKGMKFQVMTLELPTFEAVIPYFATEVSSAWWTGKGDIKHTRGFKESHETEQLIFKKGYKANDPYVQKMIKRFPNYKVKFEE